MKSWYESLATISPRSFTEIITPEIAEKLLATSSGNRRMRKKHVTYLVGAIQRGEWRVTNQGIGFDVNGHLRDGHHRLTAVVQSGEPIESLIVLGMPSDAFEVSTLARSGRRRTYSASASWWVRCFGLLHTLPTARTLRLRTRSSRCSEPICTSTLSYLSSLSALRFAGQSHRTRFGCAPSCA